MKSICQKLYTFRLKSHASIIKALMADADFKRNVFLKQTKKIAGRTVTTLAPFI